MSDYIDENGLHLSTLDETVTELQNGFTNIYSTGGDGINFDSETPDGQALTIFAQGMDIVRQVVADTYNSFDPDAAQGSILDQRLKINNIYRKEGSFSTTYITITVDKTVTLTGLDENYSNTSETGYVVTDYDSTKIGYTVQDDAGNEWYLVNTATLVQNTTTQHLFRAKEIGAVTSAVGTITTPSTVIAGVVSVINNSTQLTTGHKRESDTEAKLRRRRSVAITGQNSCDSIEAAILDLSGITDCKCYENYGQTTVPQRNGADIPLHSVWLVVSGSGDADKIAEVMYKKNGYARPMEGSVEHLYINPDTGRHYEAKWDNATALRLYMKFNVKMLGTQTTIDATTQTEIKTLIQDASTFTIAQAVTQNAYVSICQTALNTAGVMEALPLDILFSTDNSTWYSYLESGYDKIFTLTNTDIAITVL